MPSELATLAWIATDEIPSEQAAEWLATNPSPDDIAYLQYTSGSTGKRKGTKITHANVMANSRMIAQAANHDDTLVGVSWLPPEHDMGLVGSILQPLAVGGQITLMAPFSFLRSPISWLNVISAIKATSCPAPNFAYRRCAQIPPARIPGSLDLSSWRVAYCGAEPIQNNTLCEFARVFAPYGFRKKTFYPCYGLAEGTLILTGSDVSETYRTLPAPDISGTATEREWVSCGRPIPPGEALVVDPDTRCVLAEGKIGEIWAQGPHISPGYWGRENDDTFGNRLADGQGPFLRTGDLGFLNTGELFVTGRTSDIIIMRG